MEDFYSLTERGRARRLRNVVLAALERYDLNVERVRLITNETNGIFRLDTADGEKYVMRVCLAGHIAHSLEQIRSEMMWLDALGRETDLVIPAPLTTRDGKFVTTVKAPGVPEPRNCVVFSWVPGRDLSEQLTPANVEKLGAFASRLHDHGAAFRPPDGFSIVKYNRVFPFDEPVVLFDGENREFMPPERREIFQSAIAQVQGAIDRLEASGEPMRVLHGDLHCWNVRVYRGRIAAFDFEDLMWGWPIQDIATTLFYFHGGDEFTARFEAFKRGYTGQREWPERVPGELETFIIGRHLVLANDVLITPEWRHEAPDYFERTETHLRGLLNNPLI